MAVPLCAAASSHESLEIMSSTLVCSFDCYRKLFLVRFLSLHISYIIIKINYKWCKHWKTRLKQDKSQHLRSNVLKHTKCLGLTVDIGEEWHEAQVVTGKEKH